MDPTSPILSVRKGSKARSLSPVLSKKRKKRKIKDDHDETLLCFPMNNQTSPKIEDFCSPPINARCPTSPSSSPVLCTNKLRPRSLIIDFDAADDPLSQPQDSLEADINQIEDLSPTKECGSSSDDEHLTPDLISGCQTDSSASISQVSSIMTGTCCTPEKDSPAEKEKRRQHLLKCAESTKKKKQQYLPNGLAKQLSRLIQRQDSEYRLWKFQRRARAGSTQHRDSDKDCLRVSVESNVTSPIHVFTHCRVFQVIDGDEDRLTEGDSIVLLFTPERWERFTPGPGDVLCLHRPWQSVRIPGGSTTLLLGFNFVRKETEPREECLDSSSVPVPRTRIERP